MNQKWTALLLTTAMLATGASAALAYETLQPGSNGQEVLDARMRLYELGYFKKQPTQTEYTENMKKYVQQFEKDYGLTEDGILSPADQEVLFGGTQGASETVSQTSTFEPLIIPDNSNRRYLCQRAIRIKESVHDGNCFVLYALFDRKKL